MSDGTRQINNPDRVSSTLTAIDGPQAGAPRVIHPLTLLVGERDRTGQTMNTYRDAESALFTVPDDGVYQDDAGNPFQYAKGDRLPFFVAARFAAFRDSGIDDAVVPGVSAARQERQEPAPENRMEPAPENRQETAAQRKSREKAEKDADEQDGGA